MASVNRVYSTLKGIVNKDQKGFVTPSLFNEFASVAQMNIYNRLFDEERNGLRFRRAGLDAGRDFSKEKQVKEDLSVFAKRADLTKSGSVFIKPEDLGRIVSIRTADSFIFNSYIGNQVSIVYNQDDIDRVLFSDLSKPSSENPVALVSSDIEVFPTSISKLTMRYYKIPQGLTTATPAVKTTSQPKFGYSSAVAGVEIYSPTASIDFELPEHYFVDLVVEIAQLIGVNLRDADVVSYASAKVAKEEVK
jgi:hypothetical protein